MYDELVRSLRICAEGEHCDKCIKWEAKQNGGLNVRLTALCKEAADTIEELSKPRWIPVKERLPEEYVDVLCYCSRNNQYGCGMWSKEDNGTICWTGLYGMIPTHWMPLPEPPKEV